MPPHIKRFLLPLFILCLIPLLTYSNGGSPIFSGSRIGSPLTSQHIDIVKEYINIIPEANFERHIRPYRDFQKAYFEVNYILRSDTAGKQIPLLFLAMSYRNEGMRLKVWLDGKLIPTTYQIPAKYKEGTKAFLAEFGHHFPKGESLKMRFFDEKFYWYNRRHLYELHPSSEHIPLHFFEIDLTKGEHHLRVEYVADSWTNYEGDGWVTRTLIPYSLAPAKNWKSFGSLEVRLDMRPLKKGVIRTNLGKPDAGKADSILVWRFDKLPADLIVIEYEPKVNAWVNLVRYITRNTHWHIKEFMIIWLPLVLLPFLHLRSLWYVTKNKKSDGYFLGVFWGGFIVIPSVWLAIVAILYWSVTIFIPSDYLAWSYAGAGIYIERIYAMLAYMWNFVSVATFWGLYSFYQKSDKR